MEVDFLHRLSVRLAFRLGNGLINAQGIVPHLLRQRQVGHDMGDIRHAGVVVILMFMLMSVMMVMVVIMMVLMCLHGMVVAVLLLPVYRYGHMGAQNAAPLRFLHGIGNTRDA